MSIIVDIHLMGQRVRELRIKRDLTQEMLAEFIDVSASFIGHIERGEKKASLETICRLASCLDTTVDYLAMGKKTQCDKQSCGLYADLSRIVNAYSSMEFAIIGRE